METILYICGAIACIAGAIAALKKWIVDPLASINTKLSKIDKIDKGQKVLMKAQAQTMEHLISGNNVEELEKEYKNLINYCIDN